MRVVIGAGAVGASTALHLAQAGHDVLVLEKEPKEVLHQSGRNSGVIHAGYNMQPGSQKAAYCVAGNQQMRAFCQDHNVHTQEGGILVVAKNEHDQQTLDVLQERARRNGVPADRFGSSEIRRQEPFARGHDALFAPTGTSVDSAGYVQALRVAAESSGAKFRYGARARIVDDEVYVGRMHVPCESYVNVAGLHADILSHLRPDLRIIPFRGEYAKLLPTQRIRSHLYAAPNLAMPFLGVHMSRQTDGQVLVGPGAMLALAKEAYGLWSLRGGGTWNILTWPGLYRLLASKQMRQLLPREVRKACSLRAILREAQAIADLPPNSLVRSHSGVRAQVVRRDGSLEEDIVVERRGKGVHVLNCVSPGLTCSLPFGAFLAT